MKNRRFVASYSQCGEDAIVSFVLKILGKEKIFYVDIGAHHPFYLSNTACFYESGSRGVNVEPNPVLFKAFEKNRKRDLNLNLGVGRESGLLPFFVMNEPTLSTFSSSSIDGLREKGYVVEKTIEVEVIDGTELCRRIPGNPEIDFLNIDAEGIDFEILESWPFDKYCPTVVCVEIYEFVNRGKQAIRSEIVNLLESKHYFLFGSNSTNGIFVRRDKWFTE